MSVRTAENSLTDARGWTPPRRSAVTDYVARLAELLHLTDWHVSVNFEVPASADSYAEVVPHANQRRAEIRFGAAFNGLDADGIRQTLVHELMHCHLFAPHFLAEDMIVSSAGRKQSRLGLLALDAAIEQATDAIAEAFASSAPLPPRSALPPRYASSVPSPSSRPVRAARRRSR